MIRWLWDKDCLKQEGAWKSNNEVSLNQLTQQFKLLNLFPFEKEYKYLEGELFEGFFAISSVEA